VLPCHDVPVKVAGVQKGASAASDGAAEQRPSFGFCLFLDFESACECSSDKTAAGGSAGQIAAAAAERMLTANVSNSERLLWPNSSRDLRKRGPLRGSSTRSRAASAAGSMAANSSAAGCWSGPSASIRYGSGSWAELEEEEAEDTEAEA
jgi:hypothetical protein